MRPSRFLVVTFILFIFFIIALVVYLYLYNSLNTPKAFTNNPNIVIYFDKSSYQLGEPIQFYVNSASISCLEDKSLDFTITKPNGKEVVLTPICSGVAGKTKGRYCRENKAIEFIAACTDIMGRADRTCTTIATGLKGEWNQIDFNPDLPRDQECQGQYFTEDTDGVQVGPGEYTLSVKSPSGANLKKSFVILDIKSSGAAPTFIEFLQNLIDTLIFQVKQLSLPGINLNLNLIRLNK